MSIKINAVESGKTITVHAEGEVDVSNASELRDAIDAALKKAPERIVVDLAEVPYIDSTGIGVLVGAAHRGRDEGVALSVTNQQKNVARVLGMLGVEGELGAGDFAE